MSVTFPDVEKTTRLLQGLKCPYWIAGGWAIDLHLGRQTRVHKDIEIAIARDDQTHLLPVPNLAGADYVKDHERQPWRGQRLELPVHELYLRFYGGAEVEVLLNEFDGADWVYRRNKNVRLSRARFDGQQALPVEVALLFKSKSPRTVDEQDFDAVLPQLQADQKNWLAQAIALDYPDHPWLARLKTGGLAGVAKGKF